MKNIIPQIVHFCSFSSLTNTWQSYIVWFLKCGARQTKFFVILDHSLPFFSPALAAPGDIIILHMYTIIDNHVMYGSWNMECDGHFVLSFWTIFCPFNPSPLTTQKLKIKKKNEKSTWRYHHSTHLYQILWPHDARLLRYGVRRTDGQTDGRRKRRKKWHIEVSGPPKKRDF